MDALDETIKTKGNNPNILIDFDGFSQAIIDRDSFDKTT